MSDQNQIFRKVSLERLSSPEQLDQLMQVTSRKSWIALAAFGIGILLTLLWGIFGSIPTKIQGQAVLIKTGGLQDVVVSSNGRVTDLSVGVGDIVRQGQLIARLAQPELLEEMNAARARLEALKSQRELLAELGGTHSDLQLTYLQQRRRTVEEQIRIGEDRLKVQGDLLERGLITRQDYLRTQQQLEESRNQLNEIALTGFDSRRQTEEEIRSVERQIREVEVQLAGLVNQYNLSVQMISPYSGRVIEVKTNPGTLVNAGQSILSMERTGKDIKNLEAVIYVSSLDGKKIRPGMEVLISPAAVKREEHGYMVGWVTSVAEFPATQQGMMRILQNEQLVRDMLGGGAVFQVQADLMPDPDTVSGYRWTSAGGPSQAVQSGSLGSAYVTVQRQRPITLVIPILRQWLGV